MTDETCAGGVSADAESYRNYPWEPGPASSDAESVGHERQAADISVVIPTFRGGALLAQCLSSISQQETERSSGVGFSTVNAAIRQRVWQRYPFARAPIMEDKKWQRQVIEEGHVIRSEPAATVINTHDYGMRTLWRRCASEGFGWRLLGERYSLYDMVRHGLQIRVHRDLVRGLARGRIRSSAELLFPRLRPFALYWGNHWSRSVKL